MTFFSCLFGHKFEQKGHCLFCSKCGEAKTIPCDHKWTLGKEVESYNSSTETRPTNIVFLLICEKCGQHHTENLIEN